MLAFEPYLANDPELVAERRQARLLLQRYNASGPDQEAERLSLLSELLGTVGGQVTIEPPFRCDYGYNIHAGDGLYLNFDCVILDVAPVRLGRSVLLGPGVHIYTAHHPLSADLRRAGWEGGSPVTIGDDVWIGGRVVVLPGVTIGAGTVVGAGSVVTRDLPAGVVAVGNPCRVVRHLAPDQP